MTKTALYCALAIALTAAGCRSFSRGSISNQQQDDGTSSGPKQDGGEVGEGISPIGGPGGIGASPGAYSATPRCTGGTTCRLSHTTCGVIDDGCGGTHDCGRCPDDLVCDAITHTCGLCLNTTCEEQG